MCLSICHRNIVIEAARLVKECDLNSLRTGRKEIGNQDRRYFVKEQKYQWEDDSLRQRQGKKGS